VTRICVKKAVTYPAAAFRSAVQNCLAIPSAKALSNCTMDPLDFKFVDNLRPPCARCGRPLILTRIEPEEPGFDLRTYYCAACEDAEVIISAV
jgi:hypothetical protein